jgi:pSer/pThr/pTyr-binding forkhead associated (FHA) protein
MNWFLIVSSILKYVFVTTIYVFIFAIIRMIYKDITGMVKNEDFVRSQNVPVLRVIAKNDRTVATAMNDFPLENVKNVVGRSKMCDICLDDMLISGRHFCIWFEEDEWRIKDLHSRNGTYLNGQIIDEPYLLDDGDKIRVGEMEFEFKL